MDAETQSKNVSEPNREDAEKWHRPQSVNDSSENSREDEKITNDVNPEQPMTKNLENDDNSESSDSQNHGNEVEEEQNPVKQESNGSPENPNNEITSDEEYALMDKNQALDLFNKMTQESIQKILQSESSESSDESHIADNKQDIDKIINSDPQKLILLNGHSHDGVSEEVEVPPVEGENQVESGHDQKAKNEINEQAEGEQPAQDNLSNIEESKVADVDNPSEEDNSHSTDSTPVTEEHQPVEEDLESPNKDLEEVKKPEESEEKPENVNNDNDSTEIIHKEEDAKEKKQSAQEEEDEDYDPLLGSKNSKPKGNQYLDQLKKIFSQGKSAPPQEEPEEQEEYAEGEEGEQEDDNIHNQMREYTRSTHLDHYYDQYQKEQKKKHDIYRDGPATELSNDILSYERFFPGRILGNTFTIINRTNEKLTIKLSFTREGIDKDYVSKKLLEFYEASNVEDIEQPYQGYLKQQFIDAQKEFE